MSQNQNLNIPCYFDVKVSLEEQQSTFIFKTDNDNEKLLRDGTIIYNSDKNDLKSKL